MALSDDDVKPVRSFATSSPGRMISSSLQQIITRSPYHSKNLPLTPMTSIPYTEPESPEDDKENTEPYAASVTDVSTTPTPATSTSTSSPVPFQPTLGANTPGQASLNSGDDDHTVRLERWAHETGRVHGDRLYVEHDFKVERRKQLRLQKIKSHKASMAPELQQALAKAGKQRVEREAKEKEKQWEKEIFGDVSD